LQLVKSQYLNEKPSCFDEICYTKAHLKLYDNHVTKYEFFKRFVNGRKAYIENRFLP